MNDQSEIRELAANEIDFVSGGAGKPIQFDMGYARVTLSTSGNTGVVHFMNDSTINAYN